MASTSDIKKGLVIHFNNDLYSIIEFMHVKPGKGAAFVRTKLKSLTTGKVLDNTFPSGAKFDTARVERRKYQYLYKDDSGYNFMNMETFEQIALQEEMLTNPHFLQDGAEVEMLIHAETEQVLTCELPPNVVLEVTYTEPGLKGDTATNAMKPATVTGGAEVMVPLFINEGDKIKIDTSSGSYMERAK
ncbi:MAG: elongation factor P [Saprospiraceae bacterium]|nr:elongation factor P [Saprospiraceae bacterium]